MKILPNRYYNMIMRHGRWEKSGRCFQLKVGELTPEEKKRYAGLREENDIPSHKVIFYDFECYRALEGNIKKDTDEMLLLDMGGGKEYEFSLLKSRIK